MTGRALERCVGDVDRFLERDWARAARHGENAGSFDDLLSLSDVDRILSTTLLRLPAFRLVKDGKGLDPASYTKSARVGGRLVGDLADPGRVYAHFHDGATIVLQGLHRYWHPLTRFCRDLELELTHPVQANAYLSPPGTPGLAPHHDTHDVFVLQVHGCKRWVVREPLVEAPLVRHRSTPERAGAQPLLFEVELEPGDALYLPRGFVHAARAQQGLSLHLTIGVLAVTALDVVRRVHDAAADDAVLRAPLAPGWAGEAEATRRAVADVLEALAAWLARADAERIGTDLSDHFWSKRTPLLDGQLRALDQPPRLTDATVVRRRPGAVCRISADGDRLRLALGDRVVTLPAPLEPAVSRLVGGPLRIGELADLLDESSRTVLVRRLVRDGLLVVDDAP